MYFDLGFPIGQFGFLLIQVFHLFFVDYEITLLQTVWNEFLKLIAGFGLKCLEIVAIKEIMTFAL